MTILILIFFLFGVKKAKNIKYHSYIKMNYFVYRLQIWSVIVILSPLDNYTQTWQKSCNSCLVWCRSNNSVASISKVVGWPLGGSWVMQSRKYLPDTCMCIVLRANRSITSHKCFISGECNGWLCHSSEICSNQFRATSTWWPRPLLHRCWSACSL